MASFLENAAPVVAASKATIASGVGRMASAGFTSTKVVAGSVAAGMKSAIGSVSATGSGVTVGNMISNTTHFFGMGAAAAAPVVAASKATIASGVGRMASAGFTSTKVVAGSVAAGMKSAIGSVSATGSGVTVGNMISNTTHFFGMGAAAAAPVVAASKATIASGVGRMASAGFTSTKVVAGSIAAGTKSAIGSVSATGSGVTVSNMIGNAAIFFGKRTATAAAPIVAVSTATMATGVGMTAAGFSSTGIAAGSIAAGIQSAIGNVAAGTSFAGVQSFGALGGFVGMSLVGFGSLLCSSLAGRW